MSQLLILNFVPKKKEKIICVWIFYNQVRYANMYTTKKISSFMLQTKKQFFKILKSFIKICFEIKANSFPIKLSPFKYKSV